MTDNVDSAQTDLTILVAEDDLEMLELLERVFAEEGYRIERATEGDEALRAIERGAFDLVLTDLKMPKATGIDLVRAARARTLYQPVIVMTAFGSVESAVEAMKEGAYSYITKPFDIDELLVLVGECAEQVRLRKRAETLATREAEDTAFPIVFRSAAFRRLIRLVHDVAPSTATVLITGESGTGKELIAREIHRRSGRRERPFIPLDANAVPENLLESELFGHAKGSFTGAARDKAGIIEQADGGTLFLDEIGNLNAAVQAKLLRFLQERRYRRVGENHERSVDVRLIAATNRDLESQMKHGGFRDDLFYRISVIRIRVPPLRERREDVAPLAYHFLRKFNQGFRVEGFRPDVIDLLVDFDWPGNVRQLENAIEHAVILRKAGLVQRRDLPDWLNRPAAPGDDTRSLDAVEQSHILRVLDQCDGNRSRAARILGINRRTLSRKLKSYGMAEERED